MAKTIAKNNPKVLFELFTGPDIHTSIQHTIWFLADKSVD